MSAPKLLIVGGGTAGISVAARVRLRMPQVEVTLLEPSDKHFYQPLWTLVGGGVFPKEKSMRDEASVVPDGVTWKKEAAEKIDPAAKTVVTKGGEVLSYDYLVVATGLVCNWSAIPGLADSLGTKGVCSNYSYQHVDYTWETIKSFKGGKALFTHPAGAVKCGGAPQKIMWLAEDWWRREGARSKMDLQFYIALPNLFAVEKYRKTLEDEVARRDIHCSFEKNLVSIDADKKEAVFADLAGGEEERVSYDMIHVTPPMGPPPFLKGSGLVNADGWVDVDQYTLRHGTYGEVFGIGDVSSLPTSKTGAAIRKQAPVLVDNLESVMNGQEPVAKYDGYTSCPIVTARGRLVLAEFGYDKEPAETFPIDQSKPRYSMYLLKKWALPVFYWNGMLKGKM
ncbi:MAG: NAD(P)/FAD-dependent oxidoreductase [Roseibacillus sp.]